MLTVDSKRSGLDKAVYQIEQAIQRSKGKGNESTLSDLEALLDRTQQLIPGHASEQPVSDLVPAVQIQPPQQALRPESSGDSTAVQKHRYVVRPANEQQADRSIELNSFSVNDAENPLQLLAQTSELLLTPRQLTPPPAAGSVSSHFGGSSIAGNGYTHTFFSRLRSRLDIESELDPIEMGLATVPEAEVLFTLLVTLPVLRLYLTQCLQLLPTLVSHSMGTGPRSLYLEVCAKEIEFPLYCDPCGVCTLLALHGCYVKTSLFPLSSLGFSRHRKTSLFGRDCDCIHDMHTMDVVSRTLGR